MVQVSFINQQCNVMCYVCCKEFKGWCRAFTATEVILSIVEAILLSLLVTFLTFLILHLVACSGQKTGITQGQPDELTAETSGSLDWPTTYNQSNTPSGSVPVPSSLPGEYATIAPDVACTWVPSAKTQVVTQYFESGDSPVNLTEATKTSVVTLSSSDYLQHTTKFDRVFDSAEFDGEPADNKKKFIMALVKMRPPDDITFGCILTIISEFWTLTAASCIESIEEADSLDSFVMMKDFGQLRHGKIFVVSDVVIHPKYQGTNQTYDVAALKSEGKLTNAKNLLKLPTILDYLLITIGERLTILGFGKFRSIEKDAFSRGVHAVSVHVVPGAQCGARGDEWSARHLTGGGPVYRVACGSDGVCAGPLYARGTPCNYCAGTPLLQARVLLGLMSAPGPCGAPCEPALYVNLAAVQHWLNSVVGDLLL